MGCAQSTAAHAAASANPVSGASTTNREDVVSLHMQGKRGAKRENVMNSTNFDDDFEAPTYPKSKAQENVIRECIKGPDAFFLEGVSDEDIVTVINAMSVRDVKAQEEVIVQGDKGDFFYIVEGGKFSAHVNGRKVKDYTQGTFFGELALAYNKPRAATVRADTAGKLFSLEAKVFRRVIAQSAKNRYESVLDALQKVDILWNSAQPAQSNVSLEELSRVAEIVTVQHFRKDEVIIQKGTTGKIFYMIKSGHVLVKNKGSDMTDTTLGPGTYFGERALLRDAPRDADVIAKNDCSLLLLDRDTFMKVLGPYQDLINHNANMRLLDSVTLFQLLTKKEKKAVYDNFEVETFAAGTNIIEEGSSGSKFYIMKEGEGRVLKFNKNTGKNEPVRDKQTNDFVKRYKGQHFGEMALMQDEKRNATIEAVVNCEVLSIERKNFQKLVAIKDVREKLESMNKALQASSSAGSDATANIKMTDLKNLAVLGSGTFGRVTLVQHSTSGAVYALKAMLKSEIVMHKQQANVMNEKNCMLGCNHPFVLRLFQTFKDSQKLYMLLEFIQGGELFSVLHPAHPPGGVEGVNQNHAKFYSAGVLLAIAYLHNERNVAYRDMKPENCLIDAKGYPKLVDFGFAKVITSKSYTLCGTPEYLAPELVLGRGHNKAVDYWALGIMIYEMLAGYSPFSDENMDQTAICRNIIKAKLEFHGSNFDLESKNLIKGLLTREVQSRLGCLKGGTDDIKNHKWWSGFDWVGYYDQKMKAPMVPQVKGVTDTSHFDPYGAEEHKIDPSYKDTGDWDKDF